MFSTRFGTLVVGLLVSASVASAGSSGSVDSAERKDFQLVKDVAKSIDRYDHFTIFDDVSMIVQDGVVTLSGKVTMPYKRDDIDKRVRNVAGVTGVTDNIAVLPVSGLDEGLRYRIARAIYRNPNFWNYAVMINPPIHIVVEHGRVTLTGVVQSEVDRMLARSLASEFGAFSVTDALKTNAEVRDALEQSK